MMKATFALGCLTTFLILQATQCHEDSDEAVKEARIQQEGKRRILKSLDSNPEWMTNEEIRKYLAESREMNVIDITPTVPRQFKDGNQTWRSIPVIDPWAELEWILKQNFTFPQIPTEIRFEDTVTKLMEKLDKSRAKKIMEDMAGRYLNRYLIMGQDASEHVFHTILRKMMKRYSGIYSLRKVNISKTILIREVPVTTIAPQPNLVLRLEGTDELKNEIVILGAHLDSIAPDLYNKTCAISWRCFVEKAPGADDNMSGVIVLLETINVIVNSGLRPSRSLEFHFYGAEETGIIGSISMSQKYKKEGKAVVGYLNFDVVGHAPTAEDWKIGILPQAQGGFPQLNDFIILLLTTYVTEIPFELNNTCGGCLSDWVGWRAARYPATFPFEYKLTPFLHSANDTIETVNYDFIMEFAKLAVAYAVEFAEVKEQPKPTCEGMAYHAPNNSDASDPPASATDRIIIYGLNGEPQTVKEEDIHELRKTRQFIDITSNPSLRTSSGSLRQLSFPEKLSHNDSFQHFIRRKPAGLMFFRDHCIINLVKTFPNRHWQNPNGRGVTKWIKDFIEYWIKKLNYGPCTSLFEVDDGYPQRTLIFRIEGADLSKEVIILGAHLDSWTPDCYKDGNLDPDCKAPGADDNGSGMCVLLAMVHEILSASFIPERTIEFHWYSASEAGLRGSYSVASRYRAMNVNVIGMVDFNSLSYYHTIPFYHESYKIGLQTTGTDPALTQFLRNLTDSYLLYITWENNDICENCTSDFMAWSLAGYPTAHLHSIEKSLRRAPHTEKDNEISDYAQMRMFFRLGMSFLIEYGRCHHISTRIPEGPNVMWDWVVPPWIEMEPSNFDYQYDGDDTSFEHDDLGQIET